MSDEQRYDEEQGSDLPLPDADKAWQKMEALLDEDERRRRALPWWCWRTAAGLLLLTVIFSGWLYLRSGHAEDSPKEALIVKKEGPQNENEKERPLSIRTNKKSSTEEDAPPLQLASPNEKTVANLKTLPAGNKPVAAQTQSENKVANAVVTTAKKQKPYKQVVKKPLPAPAVTLLLLKTSEPQKSKEPIPANKQEAPTALRFSPAKKDSLQKAIVAKDSANKTDSVKASPPVVQAEAKAKPAKKGSPFVFSAGIGFQQALALHGGLPSLPDTVGRKKPFFDYYPSVYAKLQRGRWAAQLAFQYSVPQPVASLAFSQKTAYHAAAAVQETERTRLQKLYYHQLSLSLNYHLLPQLSVGLGGGYNLFAGALTRRELTTRYALTGVEVVAKQAESIKGYKDSFFYKTTAGLQLQTDYHWKRFSLGLRYTQNLQPFIKYTKPTGEVTDEKANALQAVLRFRLWKSGR